MGYDAAERFAQIIKADPLVVSAVAARFYPDTAPQGAAFPRVVYTLESAFPANTFELPAIDGELVVVEVAARTRAEAHAISTTIRGLAEAFCVCDGLQADLFDADRKAYIVAYAYRHWTKSTLV
jgi:hypothetical protein